MDRPVPDELYAAVHKLVESGVDRDMLFDLSAVIRTTVTAPRDAEIAALKARVAELEAKIERMWDQYVGEE